MAPPGVLWLIGKLLLSALFARISLADTSPEDPDEDDQPDDEQDNEGDRDQVPPVKSREHQRILSFAIGGVRIMKRAIPKLFSGYR